MQSQEILSALRDKKINPSDLAEALNVQRQTVYAVIRQGNGSERVAKAIATLIDKPFHTVFPYYSQKSQERLAKKRVKDRDISKIRQKISHIA